jgi:hypothetical protein
MRGKAEKEKRAKKKAEKSKRLAKAAAFEKCKQERDAALKGAGGLGALLQKWTQNDSAGFLLVASMILKGMQKNTQQAEEQEQALQFLLSCASESEEQAKIVEGAGGIPRVVEVMTANPTQEKVQELACALLHTLTRDDNKKQIEEVGAIERVVDAMESHRRAELLREEACRMLLKLPWQIQASLMDRIKALDVVGVVNQVLSENANESTKKSGKTLLALLGEHTDQETSLMLIHEIKEEKNAKGIDFVVEAMAQYTKIEKVQVAACEALHDLAELSSDTKTQIGRAGGIGLIMDAVKAKKVKRTKHKTGWGYKEQKVPFLDAKGQELACAALGILAHGCHTVNQEKIIQAGAIEWVFTAMKAYPTKKMQEMTCDLLKNVFAIGIGSVKVEVIYAIVQGLVQHCDHAQMQEAGCEALSNLARHVNNRVKIASRGGIEAILKAMARHQDDADVQRESLLFILHL